MPPILFGKGNQRPEPSQVKIILAFIGAIESFVAIGRDILKIKDRSFLVYRGNDGIGIWSDLCGVE